MVEMVEGSSGLVKPGLLNKKAVRKTLTHATCMPSFYRGLSSWTNEDDSSVICRILQSLSGKKRNVDKGQGANVQVKQLEPDQD